MSRCIPETLRHLPGVVQAGARVEEAEAAAAAGAGGAVVAGGQHRLKTSRRCRRRLPSPSAALNPPPRGDPMAWRTRGC